MPPSLQDLYLQFQPLEPLEAGDPRYVDTFEVRGVRALYQHLSLPLSLPKPATLFFSGHVGDGKTTILNQLRGRLEDEGYFVAYGEADERLDLEDIQHEDVLLALLAIVDEALRSRYRDDLESRLRQITEEIARIARLPVALEASGTLPLGPFGTITATVKDAPDIRLQVREDLRQARGPTFLDVVNEYLGRAEELVKKRGHRQLVAVLDNLDRLPDPLAAPPPAADERLFLGQASQLLSLQCRVVYTVRLALVHSHEANLGARYGQTPIIVPMIPVRGTDGGPHHEGFAALRQVLEGRTQAAGCEDLRQAFGEDAVELLCRTSGGHLRELMTLVQRACAEALAGGDELPLTAAHIEAAVRPLAALRRAAAADYREALTRVGQNHTLEGIAPQVRQILLSGRLVYEYYLDHRFWYDVCPLCQEA